MLFIYFNEKQAHNERSPILTTELGIIIPVRSHAAKA